MTKKRIRGVAAAVVLLFSLAMLTSAFPLFPQGVPPSAQTEDQGVRLLDEGERLFKDLKYEEALQKFREAFSYLKSKDTLARFYLDTSLAYFALGDDDNTKRMLRKMFEFDREKKIDEELQPKGFVKIFVDVRIEVSVENTAPMGRGRLGEETTKKKFPWLLAVAGGVVVGVVLYFLLSKKSSAPAAEQKYTLTVTKGTGILGSPDSGTYSYQKDAVASYNYSLEFDYLFYDLVVKIDGQEVSFQGNLTMDRNHTLSAAAVGWFKK